MKYFATVYGETSATTMEEYTESGSFDMKICRNMIGQIAKKLLISKREAPMLSLLYSMLGRHKHLFIRSTMFIVILHEFPNSEDYFQAITGYLHPYAGTKIRFQNW